MSELAVEIQHLSKCYHIYPGNKARLRQMFFPGEKYYEEFWALRDVSLEIERGEIFGIIGPNGAGKSTLLQILTGILQHTSGKVQVTGRVSALLELGAGFDPQYTGRENAYMNGSIMGISRKEMDRRIDNLRDFADIGDFFDRPVWMYSSGMAARLAFAVAVNMRPDILVVDEILSVGDLSFQRRCNDYIVDLRKTGVTILYVSHSLSTVENLCSRAMLLRDGQVEMIGPSSEVIRHYERKSTQGRFIPSEAVLQDLSLATGERSPDGLPLEEFLDELDKQRLEFSDAQKHPFQTGEVELRAISILDENDEPREKFKCFEQMKIRVEYFAREKIQNPVFFVAIHNSKGINCCGSRTMKGGIAGNDSPVAEIMGEGSFEVDLGRIALNSDEYIVNIGIFDSHISIPYAFSRSKTIQVEADSWNSNVGVHSPIFIADAKWSFHDQKKGAKS